MAKKRSKKRYEISELFPNMPERQNKGFLPEKKVSYRFEHQKDFFHDESGADMFDHGRRNGLNIWSVSGSFIAKTLYIILRVTVAIVTLGLLSVPFAKIYHGDK